MIDLLKEEFPNHKLGDKWDLNISQFTAWDMMEFAQLVAKKSLENVADQSEEMHYYVNESCKDILGNLMFRKIRTCYAVPKQTILDEKNIPEI